MATRTGVRLDLVVLLPAWAARTAVALLFCCFMVLVVRLDFRACAVGPDHLHTEASFHTPSTAQNPLLRESGHPLCSDN